MYIKKADLTLISLLKIYENETGNRLDIISYPSGEELLKDMAKIFNILILDVEMKQKTGIDVEALGYLIKPVQYVKKKNLIKIEIDKIIYIEKNRNVSIVHTVHGEYTCYDTLINIYNKLDISKFVYIHHRYVVNFSVIQDIGDTTVTLIDYIKVPISRRYHKSTKERFMNNKYSLGVISQKQSI